MRRGVLAGAIGCAALATLPTGATAGPLEDSAELRRGVTVNGVMAHERELQLIAVRNGGTRASGTPGYDESVRYVARRARLAGLRVSVQPFEFSRFQELSPATFTRTGPTPRTYQEETDFATLEYSGSGDVTAQVEAVDVVLPPGPTPSSNTSGCEAADFAGFTRGNVALVQRGTCTFATKAQNAQAAGAVAVIVFNEGQPGRTDVVNATLGGPGITIPVVATSFAVGEELASTSGTLEGPTVRVATQTSVTTTRTSNVIAETRGGRDDRVVVVGAHLDSVEEGPGINDNGSGSSTILEVAEEMAELDIEPRNRVRFAWWGAEESGLLGSEEYVAGLSEAEQARIDLNLNFDMLGSPNFVRFVYDGDGSDTGTAGPAGSDVIERVFLDYFRARNLPTEPTAFDGRSDYGPFIAVGIPAGGLFTGAEGIKTETEAAIYGGTAGQAYDPCYHEACDTIANVSRRAINQMSDAVAHAVLTFANREAAVRGSTPTTPRLAPPAVLEHRGSNAVR